MIYIVIIIYYYHYYYFGRHHSRLRSAFMQAWLATSLTSKRAFWLGRTIKDSKNTYIYIIIYMILYDNIYMYIYILIYPIVLYII